MKNKQKFLSILWAALIVLLLTTSVLSTTGYEKIGLNQDHEITIPKINILNITLSDDLPEEGQNVTFNVIIENKDNFSVPGLAIIVTLQQIILVNPHGKTEESKPITVVNDTLPVINPYSKFVYVGWFIAKFGQYSMTAIITSTLVKVPLSSYNLLFEVLSPPVGNYKGIGIAFTWIFTVLLVIFLLPSLIDIYYRKKAVRQNRAT